jgi:hypothetical protein
MNNTEIPYFEDEKNKIRPDMPTVERNVVQAIIFNPQTHEVLCLDWEEFDWKTFIIGGIEDNEDPIQGALREIKEETGYKNLEFVSEVGKTRSAFFAKHKNENRVANATGLLFKLIDTEQDTVKDSETVNHVTKWIPKDQVRSFINLDNQKYIWEIAEKLL